MDTQNWPKNEWEDIYHGLQEISRKMENIMFNCVDDIDAKRFAQDCYDDIETWMDNCARKGNFKVETLDLTSSKKPIKSADKHYKYDEYFGNIYDSDENNKDFWTREEYNEMVEKARDIFYPAVQKAANACRFTVSDNEAEYVAEKCVRQFFDNTSWDEAVNRPEEYYVNSSKKSIESAMPGREKGIRAIMDEYGCSWEEAEEIMNEQVSSSKKTIKSGYNLQPGEMKSYYTYRYDYLPEEKVFYYSRDEYTPDNIQVLTNLVKNQLKFHHRINRLEFSTGEALDVEYDENMNPTFIPDNSISSSRKSLKSAMPGKEKYIQAVMDEYGCSREEAEEIMNEGIESACHDKSKKGKKKPEKIEQTRRARNTESLNNLYGKMFS